MIDYETYCRIHDAHQQKGLNVTQIACALDLDGKTVTKWLAEPRYRPRIPAPRTSKLDPYKAQIRQWLEAHPYSAQQVFQRLRQAGFDGGLTIVKDYVATVRPRRAPAYLTLTFAPGECAQIDWGLCRARHRPQSTWPCSPGRVRRRRHATAGAVGRWWATRWRK
jgi:transposase